LAAEIKILITRWANVRHKVASRGIVALERIGTGDALFQLAVLAERSPAASLPRHAHNALLRIAQNRNLSRNDLEDQAYFDIDLDIRGEREFSYGTRRFRARLVPDGRLAVQVIHGDGKPARRTTWSPPPALAADPPSSVTATKAEFKQFRKQIRDMAALHRRRFELAMIMERRWNPDFFRQFIVSQPMLRIILSGLVWGIYDGDRLGAITNIGDTQGLRSLGQTKGKLPLRVGEGLVRGFVLFRPRRARGSAASVTDRHMVLGHVDVPDLVRVTFCQVQASFHVMRA